MVEKESTNLGLGLGVIYNNIHNAMNPRKGLYSEWGFLAYDAWTGSDFDFISYISDTRIYKPIQGNKVLAFQVYGQWTTGTPPFNMLALMGGETLMRGYYLEVPRQESDSGSGRMSRVAIFLFEALGGKRVYGDGASLWRRLLVRLEALFASWWSGSAVLNFSRKGHLHAIGHGLYG